MSRLAFLGVVALVGLVAAAVVFRAQLLNAVIAYLAAGGRLGAASVEVERFDLSEITLKRIDWSDGEGRSATARDVTVTFNARELIAKRRVHAIAAEDVIARIRIDPAALKRTAGGRDRAGGDFADGFAPPFDSVRINALRVDVASPLGLATAEGAGRFDRREGGAFDLRLDAPQLSPGLSPDLAREGGDEARIDGLEGDVALTLAPDGAAGADLALSAKNAAYGPFFLEAPAFAARARAGSWLNLIAGDVSGVTASGDVTLAPTRISWAAPEEAADAGPVFGLIPEPIREAEGFAAAGREGLTVRGGMEVSYADGALQIRAPDGALVLETAAGDERLAFADIDQRPAFELDADGFRIAAAIRASGRAPGDITLTAAGANVDAIDFDLGVSLAAGEVDVAAWRRLEGRLEGTVRDQTIDATAELNGALERARIGRLAIRNAALDTGLKARADIAAKSASLSAVDSCVALPSGAIAIPSQALTARVREASICSDDGALLTADWNAAPRVDAIGRLKSRDAAFALGETRFAGAPPQMDFSVRYLPKAHLSTIEMALAGGAVTLNRSLLFTDAAGRGSARLDETGLSGSITVGSAGLRQVGPDAIATPMRVSGGAELRDRKIDFDFAVATPAGLPLGAGTGVHDVSSGRGTANFATGPLGLTPSGLQPSDFSPYFTGLISETTGAMGAEFAFNWRPGDVGSSGIVRLDDVAFQGPSLAVTRTSGVSGEVALSSLLPLATPGVQSIRVETVDLDALQLSDGDIRFELPGDQTVRVPTATFGWYGGVIGAYDAASPLGVGRVSTNLRAANVDFGRLLAQLNVDGLSGEGVIEGDLPLVIEDGRARIEKGELRSAGPGVLRYTGNASALASVNGGAQIAFDALRELEFASLTAGVDGPLDGELEFAVRFEGASRLTIDDPRITDAVRVPVIYRMNIKAPALDLIREGRAAVDFSSRAGDLVRGASSSEEEGGEEEAGVDQE